MKDQDKTKEQLMSELAEMRQRVAQLQVADTERKQAEEVLRESEEKYRTVLENIEDGYFEVDVAGDFTLFNDSLCKILGYTEDELIGMNNQQYMDSENAKKVYHTFNGVYRTGKPAKAFDWEVIRKDGTRRFVETSVSLISDSSGAPIGFRGIVRDITERKQAEEALRESEERFRSIFENATIGLYRTTPDGRILMANQTLARMLGYSSFEELVQRDLEEGGFGPEYPRSAFKQRIESEGQVIGLESAWEKRDGATLFIRESARAIRDKAGNTLHYEGTVEDITERKRAEEALQRLYEQAQRDAKTKAILLDEVNHRVKNTLTAIIGLLHTEQSYAEMADQVTYEAIIQNLTNRVSGLATVHSLLAASEWGPLPLSDLAGQVIKSAMQMRPRDKQVFIDVPPSPARVTPDQAHNLAMIINELATNTIQHTLPERSTARISVRIALEDGVILFEYRDDGPGYPEDVLRLERRVVGFDLIRNLVRQGLSGELSLYNDEGAVAIIRFPA